VERSDWSACRAGEREVVLASRQRAWPNSLRHASDAELSTFAVKVAVRSQSRQRRRQDEPRTATPATATVMFLPDWRRKRSPAIRDDADCETNPISALFSVWRPGIYPGPPRGPEQEQRMRVGTRGANRVMRASLLINRDAGRVSTAAPNECIRGEGGHGVFYDAFFILDASPFGRFEK
jgi:hypothetical protein